MLRFSFVLRAAVETSAASRENKFGTLVKILTGEASFKNNTPLKASNVEFMFGKDWKDELNTFLADETSSSTVSSEARTSVARQMERLALTRYTTRELALYGGDGVDALDAMAHWGNIKEGAKYFAQVGNEEFEKHCKTEGELCNWPQERIDAFIIEVKKYAQKHRGSNAKAESE